MDIKKVHLLILYQIKWFFTKDLRTFRDNCLLWISLNVIPRKIVYFNFLKVMAYAIKGEYNKEIIYKESGMEAIEKYSQKYKLFHYKSSEKIFSKMRNKGYVRHIKTIIDKKK